MSLALMRNSLS